MGMIEIYVNLCEKAVKNSGCLDTTIEKFENTAIFLRLGLPSPLIRQKTLFKLEETENAGLCVSVDRKTF